MSFKAQDLLATTGRLSPVRRRTLMCLDPAATETVPAGRALLLWTADCLVRPQVINEQAQPDVLALYRSDIERAGQELHDCISGTAARLPVYHLGVSGGRYVMFTGRKDSYDLHEGVLLPRLRERDVFMGTYNLTSLFVQRWLYIERARETHMGEGEGVSGAAKLLQARLAGFIDV